MDDSRPEHTTVEQVDRSDWLNHSVVTVAGCIPKGRIVLQICIWESEQETAADLDWERLEHTKMLYHRRASVFFAPVGEIHAVVPLQIILGVGKPRVMILSIIWTILLIPDLTHKHECKGQTDRHQPRSGRPDEPTPQHEQGRQWYHWHHQQHHVCVGRSEIKDKGTDRHGIFNLIQSD